MAEPFLDVPPARVAAIADVDAAENYRHVLALRDVLHAAGTIEGAYLRLIRGERVHVPSRLSRPARPPDPAQRPADVSDPMRLRAAEMFFREQTVSTDDNRLMLADEEIVEMHARAGSETGLGQLLPRAARR